MLMPLYIMDKEQFPALVSALDENKRPFVF